MLEIFAIYQFCKKLGIKLRAKGRNPLGFQILLVVCWFGGELIGGFTAAVICAIADGRVNEGINPLAYLGALVGAVGGASIVYLIAHSLSPKGQYAQINAFPVQPPRVTEPTNPYATGR